MSIPDSLAYLRCDINYYARQSEFEISPSLYKDCKGVWLDEFFEHWITSEIIEGHLKNNKDVCIVSPELHGRNKNEEWADYKKFINKYSSQSLTLCTDTPEEALKYFYEN